MTKKKKKKKKTPRNKKKHIKKLRITVAIFRGLFKKLIVETERKGEEGRGQREREREKH